MAASMQHAGMLLAMRPCSAVQAEQSKLLQHLDARVAAQTRLVAIAATNQPMTMLQCQGFIDALKEESTP